MKVGLDLVGCDGDEAAESLFVVTVDGKLAPMLCSASRRQYESGRRTKEVTMNWTPKFQPLALAVAIAATVCSVASATSFTHIAFGTDEGQEARVRVYDQDSGLRTANFVPFPGFTGGARVAVGNVDPTNAGDEVVVAAGPGGQPLVRVYAVTGTLLGEASVFDAGFSGGVYVTTGDIDGDGTEEIIVGAGPGGEPEVRSFDFDSGGAGFTQIVGPLGSFLAYAAGFRGGVRVGSGGSLAGSTGVNDEIVTGAGPGGGPHVKIFDGNDGSLLNSFFAFNAKFRGGVYVSIGAADGLGPQVQVGAGEGGGPHLKVYDGDFGTGGAPILFFSRHLLHSSMTVGVRPGTVINLGIASDDPTTGGDPNNGYAFGAGAINMVRFLDVDDNPLDDLNHFWFNPFPDLPDTGVFIN